MVIMYVCNFASVEVFTKALAYLLKLLTYLLTCELRRLNDVSYQLL